MTLQAEYPYCPLCQGTQTNQIADVDCTHHPMWHEALPRTLTWLQCTSCGHVYTKYYWTDAGLAQVFRKANDYQLASDNMESKRNTWASVVNNTMRSLGGYGTLTPQTVWVDVGCGDGSLVMTAQEYGFLAIGIDSREIAVTRIKELGANAVKSSLAELTIEGPPLAVMSMMDVLEHLSYPIEALQKAHKMLMPGGVLVISCPNLQASSWQMLDRTSQNPYWAELEHHHNFTRMRLDQLLRQCGFTVDHFTIPSPPRYLAQMEIYAVKAAY